MQYIISFLEGMITFISPCLLPMLPVYISYFTGGSESSTRRTFRNVLAFILGFTILFVCMGALAGTLGRLLKEYQTIVNIITGSIVILFGLHYLGVFRLPIFKGMSYTATTALGFFPSMVFGMVFSIGWTPCVGAFLGSALMLAANRGSTIEGILMLMAYSLGLGVPFLISGILINRLKDAFSWIKKHYGVINTICGIILIIVGLLMATGLFGQWLTILA